jgi:hypothetical protein
MVLPRLIAMFAKESLKFRIGDVSLIVLPLFLGPRNFVSIHNVAEAKALQQVLENECRW